MRFFSRKILTYSVVIMSILLACKKDQNPVPEVSVDLWFYNIESDSEFSKITAPFNAVVVTGGYKNNGIIIYRLKVDHESDDFVAYDRTCPYEVSSCKMIWKSSDGFYCTCECCKSKYNLVGEYMENGPAEYPLRKYKTEFIDGNLHIY